MALHQTTRRNAQDCSRRSAFYCSVPLSHPTGPSSPVIGLISRRGSLFARFLLQILNATNFHHNRNSLGRKHTSCRGALRWLTLWFSGKEWKKLSKKTLTINPVAYRYHSTHSVQLFQINKLNLLFTLIECCTLFNLLFSLCVFVCILFHSPIKQSKHQTMLTSGNLCKPCLILKFLPPVPVPVHPS